MSGFLMPGGKTQFGRPAGLAVMKDGSLLVSDDDSGVIYRVAYRK
jgi:glucose/arabinose dehydrogenase